MRYFSIEEANDLVPLLQDTFAKVRAQTGKVGQLSARLAHKGDSSDPGDPIPEDLPEDHRKLRERRDELVGQIREALGGLVALGVEVKRLDGMVDFPSRKSGQPVNLCWQFGEAAVEHWHELTSSDGGRRAIGAVGSFEPKFLN